MSVLAQDLEKATRWPALDGVRGFACVLVVAYHGLRLFLDTLGSTGEGNTPLFLWPLGTARFTIDAFFVLSGFLIVVAWDRMPRFGHFYSRRFRRIFPVYWVSVVVLVLLTAPAVLTSPGDLGLLVSMQGYLTDGLTDINVPWWSLTTELHFYLLVPLLAPLLRLAPLRWLLFVGTCVLSAWWWHLGAFETGFAPSLLPGRLHEFVIGALLGGLVRRHERGERLLLAAVASRVWVGRVLFGALLALGTYHGSSFGHYRDHWFDDGLHVIAGLLLGGILLHLLTRADAADHWLTGPRVRAPGLVSYSLYLWHYPILVTSLVVFGVDQTPLMALPALAVGFALSGAAAYFSYRWLERPFLRPAPPATPEGAQEPTAVTVPGREPAPAKR